MNQILEYILQVNVLLSIIYLGYYFLLRNLTFYRLNRGYLIVGAIYSFFYPLFDISSWFKRQVDVDLSLFWSFMPEELDITDNVESSALTLDKILLIVFGIGVVLLFVRFFVQLLSLVRLHFSSESSRWNKYLYRNVLYPIVPFSFFNLIYLHKAQHSELELYDIFEHEYIHVKGFHSLDIILFEILLISCWYNPFVWLMRKAVRQNLEFLTDQQVLSKGVDRQSYQFSLLNVTQHGAVMYIGNKFNFKTLKKRIMMMNKKRSSKLELSKYVFLLPVFIFLGASFTVNKIEREIEQAASFAAETDITQVIPKNLAIQNTNNVVDGQGFLLDGVLVEKEAIQSLRAEDIESVILNQNNALTEKFNVQTIVKIDTKKHAGTLGTPSQFKSIDFLKNGQINIEGPLKGISGENIYEESVIESNENLELKQDSTVHFQGKGLIIRGMKKSSGEFPLIVFDSKEMPSDYRMEKLNPDEIESLTVFKDSVAIARYGNKGKNGVIEVVTKKADQKLEDNASGISIRGIRGKLNSEQPLIVIDGQPMESDFDISTMTPEKIQSITILKDNAAREIYGERAKDGVMMVVTKTMDTNLNEPRLGSTTSLSNPAYLVDGKLVDDDEYTQIDRSTIKSIATMTKQEAEGFYKGKYKLDKNDGVVVITTK